MRGLLLVAVLLASAAPARAGGEFVDVAASGRAVWVVGAFGVRAFDARDGALVYAPQPTGPAYLTSVAFAGGAAWVASVENGFSDGRITRIDLRTRRSHVVFHAASGGVEYVAAGAGGVYALVGARRGNRVVRLSARGVLTGEWRVGGGGRIAADASGCWVSAEGALLHIDLRGRLQVAARLPFGDVATGAGAVWLGLAEAVVRVDERSGRARRLPTGRLRLGGFQHDIAVGDGRLWTIRLSSRRGSALEERALGDGGILRSTPVAGAAKAIAVTAGAIWVATADTLVGLDPRTLRPTLSVPLL